ncbi:hypothetical protein [Haliea salexigens]|uniref:hypothetical protein n=1 Tax=Haliea salexigens TaxID=287487 RepID=UPI00042018B8|nr:hypothetical protein [Haliea salexigens]
MSNSDALFVGHYSMGDTQHFFEVSEREVSRMVTSVSRVLKSFDRFDNDCALVISPHDAWLRTVPLQRALIADRKVVMDAEDSPFEAPRIEAFMRRMRPSLVFGISSGVLEGLKQMGFDARTLFANAHVWVTDAGAYTVLQEAECKSLLRWAQLGPAVGLECAFGGGVHVSERDWVLAKDPRGVLVSSRLDPAPSLQECPTGVMAEIVTQPCGCGAIAPRVDLWREA